MDTRFKIGDKVRHYLMGLGTITDIGEGYIDRGFVVVDFDDLQGMVKDSRHKVPAYEIEIVEVGFVKKKIVL